MSGSFATNLIVWYVVFLFSTTLHEAAHACAAAWGGDNTASMGGQASLNPIPHIQREKFGMVLMPLASFFLNGGSWMIGWASTPFNPYWAARYPRRSFVMSLAGPLSHLLPLGFAWTVMYIGLRNGFFQLPSAPGELLAGSGGGLSWALAMFMSVLFRLNVLLLIFNLMPFPPLDGSEVWYLLMKSEESRLRWRHLFASYSLAGIVLAYYVFPDFFYPVFRFLVLGLYAGAGY